MIAMTTNSSINVNPRGTLRREKKFIPTSDLMTFTT
jgi:hypothetical protein